MTPCQNFWNKVRMNVRIYFWRTAFISAWPECGYRRGPLPPLCAVIGGRSVNSGAMSIWCYIWETEIGSRTQRRTCDCRIWAPWLKSYIGLCRNERPPVKHHQVKSRSAGSKPRHFHTFVYSLICKRTYRICRIASSANASEQSQILYVLYYGSAPPHPLQRNMFQDWHLSPSFIHSAALFVLLLRLSPSWTRCNDTDPEWQHAFMNL